MRGRQEFRRARASGRWSEAELAEVVLGVLRGAPDVLWSADDVRERLAFGHEGAGPAATSVRGALRALEADGRVERVDVWGRQGWGNTAYAFRPARPADAAAAGPRAPATPTDRVVAEPPAAEREPGPPELPVAA